MTPDTLDRRRNELGARSLPGPTERPWFAEHPQPRTDDYEYEWVPRLAPTAPEPESQTPTVPLQEPGYIAECQRIAEPNSTDNGSQSVYQPTFSRFNANSLSVPDVGAYCAPLQYTEPQQTHIRTRDPYTDREAFDQRMSFNALHFLKGVIYKQ